MWLTTANSNDVIRSSNTHYGLCKYFRIIHFLLDLCTSYRCGDCEYFGNHYTFCLLEKNWQNSRCEITLFYDFYYLLRKLNLVDIRRRSPLWEKFFKEISIKGCAEFYAQTVHKLVFGLPLTTYSEFQNIFNTILKSNCLFGIWTLVT